VAETSEELLDKYLAGEKISMEEVKKALHDNVIHGELTPVLVGSVIKNIGVETMLKMLIDFSPSPDELKEIEAQKEDGTSISVKTIDEAPFSGFVFKTMVDPFVGTISFIKINSGTLKLGDEVYHPNVKETL